jgi:iron-sulfur cluster assembly accessory protein
VTGGGCHSFQYFFQLETGKIDKNEDTVFEADLEQQEFNSQTSTARVIMDCAALKLLNESIVDYTTSLIGSRFTVMNLCTSSSCGCETSFDI